MLQKEILARLLPHLKAYSLPLSLGLIGILCLGYGLMQSVGVQRDSTEITFQSAQQPAKSETKTALKEITLDVEGAVKKPGIHALPPDSRVQDALAEAGGMTEKADRLKVSKGMNLAAKVIDGGKIYIPFVGEPGELSGTGGVEEGGGSEQRININTASESELDTLAGVGPATAQKIIGNRPYGSVEELVSKKSVGKSVFEKIKDKISI